MRLKIPHVRSQEEVWGVSVTITFINYKGSMAGVEPHPGSLEDGLIPEFTSLDVTEMGDGRSSRQVLSILGNVAEIVKGRSCCWV